VRDERLAENESLFRSLNESVAVDQLMYDPKTGRHAFLCECWDTQCVERLWLAPAEYESVRAEPVQFVVASDHTDPAIEEIVSETDRYAVVRKRGEAAEVAEELDPRS